MAIGGDGRCPIGQTIVKGNAKKVRRLGKGDVIGGLPAPPPTPSRCSSGWRQARAIFPGQLMRAAVELAKEWRTPTATCAARSHDDRRRQGGVARLTGTGDVLEPESGVMGIGSGGNYALAAARALADGPLDAEAIVRKSLDIAADNLRLHQSQRHHRN